jgi:hypothetical protein
MVAVVSEAKCPTARCFGDKMVDFQNENLHVLQELIMVCGLEQRFVVWSRDVCGVEKNGAGWCRKENCLSCQRVVAPEIDVRLNQVCR